MNIVQVFMDIRFRTGDLWARPVRWHGSGDAVTVIDGAVVRVPHGPNRREYPLRSNDIVGDWELVDPSVVIDEPEPPKETTP